MSSPVGILCPPTKKINTVNKCHKNQQTCCSNIIDLNYQRSQEGQRHKISSQFVITSTPSNKLYVKSNMHCIDTDIRIYEQSQGVVSRLKKLFFIIIAIMSRSIKRICKLVQVLIVCKLIYFAYLPAVQMFGRETEDPC